MTRCSQPKEGEYRVVKHKYDAFFATDLNSILRNNRIKTIIIVGAATNVCCKIYGAVRVLPGLSGGIPERLQRLV